MINKKSSLYKLAPDIVFLSIDFSVLIEDILYSNKEDDSIQNKVEIRIDETLQLIKNLSENLPYAQIFMDSFYLYRPSIMGTLEFNSSMSITETLYLANYRLATISKDLSNIKIIDIMSLIISKGSGFLFDERMYYLAKCHWSFKGIDELSKLYKRYIKCI